MQNEFYTTHDYNLNITRTPEKTIEHFSNTRGWIKIVGEGGADSTTYYGSNFTYLENAYSDAKASLESYKKILEQVKSGAEVVDGSYSSYTGDVYINELMPDPGVNGTEWAELYNNGSSSIDIGGWSFDDAAGGSSPYTIPEGTSIGAKGFLVLYGNSTGVQLNNGGDSARLFDSSGGLVDSIDYSSSEAGISLGRVPDGSPSWSNMTTPTPGYSNS
jgi:hypothetical protein